MATPLRILVADDEAILGSALAAQLGELEHRVIGPAYDGRQALELAASHIIDLAILDVRMPGLDGIEVARRLTEARTVPIIFLTAYYDPEIAFAAAELPVFHFLLKPIASHDLAPAIAVACARFAEWSELQSQTQRLENKLQERAVVEQAKELLMRVRAISEDEAYRTIRRESQNRNRTMADVARTLLAAEALFRDPISP